MDKPPLPGHAPGDAETQQLQRGHGGVPSHRHVPSVVVANVWWWIPARTSLAAYPHPSHCVVHGRTRHDLPPQDHPWWHPGRGWGLLRPAWPHPWNLQGQKQEKRLRVTRQCFMLGVSSRRLRQTRGLMRDPWGNQLGTSPAPLPAGLAARRCLHGLGLSHTMSEPSEVQQHCSHSRLWSPDALHPAAETCVGVNYSPGVWIYQKFP